MSQENFQFQEEFISRNRKESMKSQQLGNQRAIFNSESQKPIKYRKTTGQQIKNQKKESSNTREKDIDKIFFSANRLDHFESDKS